MPDSIRPAESSTCKPLILILGSAAAGMLFTTDTLLVPGILSSRVLVVGDLVNLPQQETFVVNVAASLVILIILLPLLHAVCVRWYVLLFKR